MIAIVGASVAGALLAHRLASAERQVLLFEHQPDWEKPCGGGCTFKIFSHLPEMQALPIERNPVRIVELEMDGRSARLTLQQPVFIYSRSQLDRGLLDLAVSSGARLIPERVTAIERRGSTWHIQTTGGIYQAEGLVGADGARSLVRRRLAQPFETADLSMALGYYVPGAKHLDTMLIQFFRDNFDGYVWSFPRTDHLSVGIIHSLAGRESSELRRRVSAYIAERYGNEALAASQYFGALVPALRTATLDAQRCSGPDWLLVGDAAGFVDPITGEGIHYALRSAELAAESILQDRWAAFDWRWRDDFGAELRSSAHYKDRFYLQSTLGRHNLDWMLALTRRSACVRDIQGDFIAGRSGYAATRGKLVRSAPKILAESLLKLAG
ncbi:MAG: NAD(P)/FAD-dependent oxidoreductase [Acidobacteriota bacterium]